MKTNNRPVTLILGASSTVGMALCEKLKQSPGTLILHHHRADTSFAKALKEKSSAKIEVIRADFAQSGEVASLVNQVKELCGHPDRIVHLPALPLKYVRFKDFDWVHFEKDFQIQFRSVVEILRNFLPLMSGERTSKVVFLGSTVTHGITPKCLTMYATIKYAVGGLMRSLASEFASSNVSINSVSPSMINTEFLRDIPSKMVELEADKHPKKRLVEVSDVVPALEFLLSDASDAITGVDIPVTGGESR